MPNITEFPDRIPGAKDITITLNGTEWMAVALKISDRPLNAVHTNALETASAKIFKRLGKEG